MVTNSASTVSASSSKVASSHLGIVARLKRLRRTLYLIYALAFDSGYDFLRYLRQANYLPRTAFDVRKRGALLFFYYHKIEKSLSLPQQKNLFGLGYIDILLDLMDEWLSQGQDPKAVPFAGAVSALEAYQVACGTALSAERPGSAARLSAMLERARALPGTQSASGAVLSVHADDLSSPFAPHDYEEFVARRHSVRNFDTRPVSDAIIQTAARMAGRSPSVCNRQGWRLHVYTTPADKAAALHYQNGNSGFGHLADRVLLVSADLRAFLTSGERHQAYSDAGMFAMSLVYALHAQGVASCCLNACLSYGEERALRRACRLPVSEVPVMLIAVGYPAAELRLAASPRLPVDDFLTFHSEDALPIDRRIS